MTTLKCEFLRTELYFQCILSSPVIIGKANRTSESIWFIYLSLVIRTRTSGKLALTWMRLIKKKKHNYALSQENRDTRAYLSTNIDELMADRSQTLVERYRDSRRWVWEFGLQRLLSNFCGFRFTFDCCWTMLWTSCNSFLRRTIADCEGSTFGVRRHMSLSLRKNSDEIANLNSILK